MNTTHRWRAFTVLAVAYFMTIVDLTIVNVALPSIGRDLHLSESDLQWVVTAYGLTFGGLLLLGGRAADLLGRRRIFLLGLTVFTSVQGTGAAIVLPPRSRS
jgi:MFS family permease